MATTTTTVIKRTNRRKEPKEIKQRRAYLSSAFFESAQISTHCNETNLAQNRNHLVYFLLACGIFLFFKRAQGAAQTESVRPFAKKSRYSHEAAQDPDKGAQEPPSPE